MLKNDLLKRLLDICLSLVLIIALAPFMIIISLAIILETGFPVLFTQKRVGRNGQLFSIYKFRTMLKEEEENPIIITGDEVIRITRVGRALRKFGLDELPQLFNVIIGDMSIVGPRPTLPYQVERYNARQLMRLSVKPGITGWAQVNGRNSINWINRIEHDLWYVENRSLFLDLKIILKTPFAVLDSRGLYTVHIQDSISGKEPVIIVGAGGHGKVVADILLKHAGKTVLGFLDDSKSLQGCTINSLPVLGKLSLLPDLHRQYAGLVAVVAVGDNRARHTAVNRLNLYELSFATVIHPSSIISDGAEVGEGTVVMAGSVINTGAIIGNQVIINTSATIDHDCHIDNFAHISPGTNLAGGVRVGVGAHIGAGAVVLPGLKIGPWSIVGAGSVVTKNIRENTTVIGVPAQIMESVSKERKFSMEETSGVLE